MLYIKIYEAYFLTVLLDLITLHLMTQYEQIACMGLKPHYNGSAVELILMLNLICIWWQNKTWYPATLLLPQEVGTEIEIAWQFSKVSTKDVEKRVKHIWENKTIAVERHTRGTAAYYAWIFGVFI